MAEQRKKGMAHHPLLLLFLLLQLHHECGTAAAAALSEVEVLLTLKSSLRAPASSDVFSTWNSTAATPCSFSGVTCAASNNSVSSISLPSASLSGVLPFSLLCSNLPSLTSLSFPSNFLSGALSPAIRNCSGLTDLNLSFNSLSGEVPDLSSLTKLQTLNISDNNFSGPFPWSSLRNLAGLRVLSLGDNPFDRIDSFPDVVCELTGLEILYLSDTNIGGTIPPAIGNLTRLQVLEISDNFISGEIPNEIGKLTNLIQLEMYNNSLTGELPEGFRNLTRLQFFDGDSNNLSGSLSVLRWLTNLVSLQLFYNNFSGEIPPEFGDFKYLVNLSLYSNRLTGMLPEKLGSWSEFIFIDVSTNNLTGPIPPAMCAKGTMRMLLMLENNFTGEIPASYGNCTTMKRFRVSTNMLTGVVPPGIWSLPRAEIIDLEGNNFEGSIGAGIGMATALAQLYLSRNLFSGTIPPEISGAKELVEIDVSVNTLSGEIPASIGELRHLVKLSLEDNSLGGVIPETIGSCSTLSVLNVARNEISGSIPASLGEIAVLNSVDLSRNELTGQVPASLAGLKLSYLNLSDNRLSGPVPDALAIDAYSRSFAGNPGLCSSKSSSATHFLPSCSRSGDGSRGNSDKVRNFLVALLAAAAFSLAVLGLAIFFHKRRFSGEIGDGSSSGASGFGKNRDSWSVKSFRVLGAFDEQEIVAAIRGENLIGKGGSGEVYRVHLSNGSTVAVKHIANDDIEPPVETDSGSSKAMLAAPKPRRSVSARCREFEAEVGTLSKIRHFNVVKLFCSITSADTSLLVYEYLPNGSLWERLHTDAGRKLGGLDWETRYDIAVGAARGLEYLHHGCGDQPVIHRDMKSSNILLDERFQPRIADFGLAKMLCSGDSSTRVIAGTYGYIAPEYGYGWRATEKSDVYSFGVVLMELVTGKRPIEAEYGDNRDIVYWVTEKTRGEDWERVKAEVVDGTIGEEWAREEAMKMLRVALHCAGKLPSTRPSMRTVVKMLEVVRGRRPSAAGGDGKLVAD